MPHLGIRATPATLAEYRRVRRLARAVRPEVRVDSLVREALRHFAKALRREAIRNGIDPTEVESALGMNRSPRPMPVLPQRESSRIREVRPR